MRQLKVFDKDGTLGIRFAKDDDKGISKWLGWNGTKAADAMPHAREVNDSVLGTSLRFPCEIGEAAV